jgi:EAL domain-containing protein (putative c-di-GMP-specific phosphodiesterase class I)
MYRAKAHHTGVEIYDPSSDTNSQAKLNLLGELRDAIPNGELVLYYQPKIDVSTRQIVGVEALVRWNHPERGFTPPDEFIPLAERTGLINPLTDWVMEAALAQSHAWRGQGLDLGVAVNISVRCLYDRAFPERVADALERWMVPASNLKLEITEGMLMADPRRAMPVLAELEKMGLSLALDDFGTGYSSLAYLKKLPVGELKIDKSFVMHMTEDQADSTIVRTTIDMARNLGLHVVAEGVESQEILDLLALFGCNLAQGYHISRPLPVDTLAGFLTDSGLLVARLAPRIPEVARPPLATPDPARGLTSSRPLQMSA